MKLNRVWIATILIIFGAAFYEVRLKPQSRPLYESALSFYHQGNYSASLGDLQRAYAILDARERPYYEHKLAA